MNMRLLAVALPMALMTTSLQAQFTPTGGSFGSLPQATFGGTGISNAAVQQGNNVGNVVLGLSATPRFSSPALTNDGAGTFNAMPGFDAGTTNRAAWNFDFYIGGSGTVDKYFSLFVDNDPAAGTTSFQRYNLTGLSFANGVKQDSWNIGFNFIGGNPLASGEYDFALVQYSDVAMVKADDMIAIRVNVGDVPPVTATPEPASMVLLGTGLLGVFGVARRRRRSPE